MYYDYKEAIRNDVEQAIRDNYTPDEIVQNIADDKEGFAETLNDDLLVDDAVTGNGSGSYTFNRNKAAEYLASNFDLLAEAVEEFGGNMDVIKDGPEACDVTIRCYLLYSAISGVLDDMEEEYADEIDAYLNDDEDDDKKAVA